jgi:diguanylate cyclase (GGDEF)-like protein
MTRPLHILIVDDDAVDRKSIRRDLKKTSLEMVLHETASAEDCLKFLGTTEVDCILLDYRLPEMNGIDFLTSLRSEHQKTRQAIVMLTGSGNERLVVQAMRLGVQDYLVKGDYTPDLLEAAIRHAIETLAAEKASEEEGQVLEQMALVDSVTGIGNRNFFNIRLEHALNRARRQNDSVCLFYLDLDRFKDVNDSLGHNAGDAVLQQVAQRLAETARDVDTIVRLGGDEFALIMETGVTKDGTARLAARLRKALSAPMTIKGTQVSIGVSIGTATFPEQAESFDALVHAADVAMYETKFGGRLDTDLGVRAG